MVSQALNEYVTYETFYTLNKQCTSQSCVAVTSNSSVFYDLDSVAKRHSYGGLTEEAGLSTSNILKALNTKMDLPKAPIAIVQECTTTIKPRFKRCHKEDDLSKQVNSVFLRECVLSSGICLKDSYAESESSGHLKSTHYLDEAGIMSPHENCSYQAEYFKSDGYENNKKDSDKNAEEPCPCDLYSFGCPCKEKNTSTEGKHNPSLPNHHVTSPKKEVCTSKSSRNKTYTEKEDKLTCMSGDGFTGKYKINLANAESSCILVMDPRDVVSQLSTPRKSVRLVRVITNKLSKIKMKSPKKPRALRCPNCNEHIEFTMSTDDEASIGFQPKAYHKSETAFTYMAASKERIHTNPTPREYPNKCPHGCEMVPLCQIVPKANIVNHTSSMKQKLTKKPTPHLIRITKACRHYPPCTVVPSCQRTNVLKGNCDSIPPCCHRPRCVNLPLCIPFSKNIPYDETIKNYVDYEDNRTTENCYIPQLKYIPVSQCKLLEKHVVLRKPHTADSKAFYVNQTYLPCQVTHLNTKQSDNATKSCQYDSLDHKTLNNAPNEASIVYIRDVGCQFKNSSFTPHSSYFQTRVCLTSSASFDPGSKRLDHLYTNPNAVRCEAVIIDAKSHGEYTVSTQSLSSAGVVSRSSKRGASRKVRSSGFKPDTNTPAHVATFYMLSGIDGSYLIPVKATKSYLKRKYKNKFSIRRRQISDILSDCCSKS